MNRKLKHILFTVGLLLTAFLTEKCANQVAPTGGPKDTTPPVVVKALPENNSTNYLGRKIELTFDEYVTLENANQNVLISPPLTEKPDIKLHNKTLTIKFKEELEDNTTYSVHFGNAIKDLHEGNLFQDYVFRFSTGDYLDSLSIAGKVLSAEEKKPVENAFVGLYAADRVKHIDSTDIDSLPMRIPPHYITKTDKEGHFHIGGVADTEYLIFALKDVNSNLYFDQPNEEVAFLDSLVRATDSTEYTLYLFTEIDSTQVLLEKKLVEEGLLRFVFRHPAKDAVIMTPEMLPDTFNLVALHSAAYDTVWWYFTPNVKDSLWVQVKLDTLINDSSRYSLKFKESSQRRSREPEKLKVTDNLIGRGGVIVDNGLILNFSEPVVRIELPDSVPLKFDSTRLYNVIEFEQVDDYGLKYRLKVPIEEGTNYSLELPDSVFYGIRNRTNGPIKLEFHVLDDDEYGNIYITVAPPMDLKQVVLQLTDESGKKVLKEEIIKRPEEVVFDHLMPAKYRLRAILDADANGKWSTGNYSRHTLPEIIVEYKDVFDVKAGWDIDLEDVWEL